MLIWGMQSGPKIAEIAALVGDPARANILMALMAGRALTASELAYFAHVTPQTASTHLAKLVDGGILVLTKQGRHRYFRLASPVIGRMLEGIMAVAEGRPVQYHPHWRGGEELRFARVCYDHLAGELAVRIADALAAQKTDSTERRWRRGDIGWRSVAHGTRDRCRFIDQTAAYLLPAVPRLEYAAATHCRRCWRGAFREIYGNGVAEARQDFARTHHHASGTSTSQRLIRSHS